MKMEKWEKYAFSIPTYLFTYLKRLLPTAVLDRILHKAGK